MSCISSVLVARCCQSTEDLASDQPVFGEAHFYINIGGTFLDLAGKHQRCVYHNQCICQSLKLHWQIQTRNPSSHFCTSMTESQADAEEVHLLNLIVQRGLCISNCQVFGYIQQLHSAGFKPNAAHCASAIRSCAKEARQRVDIYIYIYT